MQCDEIIRILEKKAPVEYAMDWDHVGLLVGRRSKEVRRLLLAVDVTNDVINMAIQQHVDMIVSHHPMIFGSVDRVNDDTVLGRKILELWIENTLKRGKKIQAASARSFISSEKCETLIVC